MIWALITGEYPPQRGGVADYTLALARALRATGGTVHVFAPACATDNPAEDRIIVHRLPRGFTRSGRRALNAALAALPKPRAAVLQYVPQSFGMRGCNVPFANWLRSLAGYPLYVMFHEVSVTVLPDTALKYRLQAFATRAMARTTIASADAIFISTPAWATLIRRLGKPRADMEWTPVPSNVALTVTAPAVAAVRRRFAGAGTLLGHFGTYREPETRTALVEMLPLVLGANRSMVLLGRGGELFAAELCMRFPSLADRVYAPGELDAQDLADHLAACDLVIQPFADGVSARRGSITASLALGVPIITTEGFHTEELWRSSGAVELTPSGSTRGIADAVARLANDPAMRAALSTRGRALYAERFAIEHTVAALQSRSIEANYAVAR